jgi:hypothetical protein
VYSEPCYWANHLSKDGITLCCDIMGALTTFLLYKGAILIGPSAIICGKFGMPPTEAQGAKHPLTSSVQCRFRLSFCTPFKGSRHYFCVAGLMSSVHRCHTTLVQIQGTCKSSHADKFI